MDGVTEWWIKSGESFIECLQSDSELKESLINRLYSLLYKKYVVDLNLLGPEKRKIRRGTLKVANSLILPRGHLQLVNRL